MRRKISQMSTEFSSEYIFRNGMIKGKDGKSSLQNIHLETSPCFVGSWHAKEFEIVEGRKDKVSNISNTQLYSTFRN